MNRPPAAPAPSGRPLLTCGFRVDLGGGDTAATGLFRSVSGLHSETEVIPYAEGGRNDTTTLLVGATRFGNLVLKGGFTGPPFTLLRWREAWAQHGKLRQVSETEVAGGLVRLDGTISMLDTAYNVVCAWRFVRGWPCRWEGPELDASKNELAIETLEIAHEGLVLASGSASSG